MREFPEEDIEMSFFRSSGPGGQKKNTADTAVRVRHKPTGIVTIGQRHRSQLRNREEALNRLAERLAERRRRRKPRKPTKPSKAAKQRRVDAKKHRGRIKQLRKPPSGD